MITRCEKSLSQRDGCGQFIIALVIPVELFFALVQRGRRIGGVPFFDSEASQSDLSFRGSLFFSGLVSDRQRFFVGLAGRRQIASIGKDIAQSSQHVRNRILVVDLLGRGFGLLVGGLGSLQITLLPGQLSQIV